jgi:O-succinylbenzoic acid--CoA ligase
VADVAVAGLPDAEWGAVVTAFVVPAGAPPSLDALRDHVKAELPAFAAPRHLILLEAIPRTALGKIRRAALTPHPRV